MHLREREKPRIYVPNGELVLPSYLHVDREAGKLIYTTPEGQKKLYDWFIDFGHSQDDLRGSVLPEERVSKDRPELKFLGFSNPKIVYSMGAIQAIANNPRKSPEVRENQDEYRAHLAVVYRYLAQAVQEWIGGERAVIFPPKNGGRFVQEVYEDCGIPHQYFYDYQMSRIHRPNEGLMLGVNFGKNNPDIAQHHVFVIADDCLASKVSAWGTLEMIKSRVPERSRNQTRVLIAVSAASQRGMEDILRPEVKKHFGFERIEGIAAIPVFMMDEHFYLLMPDGKTMVVGDMGKWTNIYQNQAVMIR